MMQEVLLRELHKNDEGMLYDMLYHSIFVLEGREAPPRDIVYAAELSKYVKDFGTASDMGYGAFDMAKPIGAAWLRCIKGYGYVNDASPELSIAVIPDYRGKGIGTLLLEHLLTKAKTKFSSVSLSVWASNPALRLYQRFGFEKVQEKGNEVTMLKTF